MTLLYKTRARQAEEIFQRFDAGEEPTALISNNVASANIVYKYRRIWLVLRIRHELDKIVASRSVKRLSLKKLENFLDELKLRGEA